MGSDMKVVRNVGSTEDKNQQNLEKKPAGTGAARNQQDSGLAQVRNNYSIPRV
jgi:hypothetical protein